MSEGERTKVSVAAMLSIWFIYLLIISASVALFCTDNAGWGGFLVVVASIYSFVLVGIMHSGFRKAVINTAIEVLESGGL